MLVSSSVMLGETLLLPPPELARDTSEDSCTGKLPDWSGLRTTGGELPMAMRSFQNRK